MVSLTRRVEVGSGPYRQRPCDGQALLQAAGERATGLAEAVADLLPQARAGRSESCNADPPDETLRFRFSAFTAKAHRIHYDTPYCRDVEALRDSSSTARCWRCRRRSFREGSGRGAVRTRDIACVSGVRRDA